MENIITKQVLYYILDSKNTSVVGVIAEDDESVDYYDLHIVEVFNQFNNRSEKQLLPYVYSGLRNTPKTELKMEHVLNGNIIITKDYWVAFAHANGGRGNAIIETT